MQIKTVFVYQFSEKTIHRRLEREPGAIGIFPFSQSVFVSCTKFNQRAMIFQWLLFCKLPSHWMRSNNYFDVYQTKGSFEKWMNNEHNLFIAVPLKSNSIVFIDLSIYEFTFVLKVSSNWVLENTTKNKLLSHSWSKTGWTSV